MTILVDSNILIFLTNQNSEKHETAKKKFESLLEEENKFAVNSIIVSEFLHIIGRDVSIDAAKNKISELLGSEYIEYKDIQKQTIEKSLKSMKSYRKIRDSILAQQAKDMKLKIFTDNTKDFKSLIGPDNLIGLA